MMKILSSLKKVHNSKAMALALAFIILFTAFGVHIEPTQASSSNPYTPGSNNYYNWEFENTVKPAAGWKTTGTYTNSVSGNPVTVTNEGPWNLDIDYTECSAPWNGSTPTSVTDADLTTLTNGAYNALSNPYLVYTARQFRYCVVNHRSFQLQNDIDLGGYLYSTGTNRIWTTPAANSGTWIADGKGYTVYNYFMSTTSTYQSMFGPANNVTVRDLRISNSYARGYASDTNNGARIALFITSSGHGTGLTNVKIQNCAAENSIVYVNDNDWGAAVFAVNGTATTDYSSLQIDNCYTNNCHVVVFSTGRSSCCAQFVQGGSAYIINSFAINGTVIGNVGHNGGFVSCCEGTSTGSTLKNCFADVEVYGNMDAGAFIGIQHRGTHTVENCFTVGKVEGTNALGGFIGAPDTYSSAYSITTTIKQCYSAAMVGMMSNAQRQGSFMGTYRSRTNWPNNSGTANYNIIGCYGVGEVGSLDVDVSSTRSSYGTTGGFIGEYTNAIKFTDCYYDKQTTAMREWAAGDYLNGTYTSTAGTSAVGILANAKGLLTTDTVKSGTGLSGTSSKPGLDEANGWALEEALYPQLDVFANPLTFTNTNWMTQAEMTNLVKAYSMASVSTAFLETWEEDYDGNPLPKTTYDTVRDLTMDLNLSSSKGSASLYETAWEKDGAKTALYGDEVDVLNIAQDSAGSWYVDKLSPGIEWLTVNCTVGNQVGHRRMRIIPTAGLDGGNDKALTSGSEYDHADDVRLAFSTGKRMSDSNNTDITTGIFPDNPVSSYNQPAYQTITGTTLNSFNAADNLLKNVYAGHLAKTSSENAYGSEMEVLIYTVTNSAASPLDAELGEQLSVDNSGSASPLNDIFNGKEGFYVANTNQYLIRYIWKLADKRYIQSDKLITVHPATHTVTVNAVNADGTANETDLYLSADTSAGFDFGSDPRDTHSLSQTSGQAAYAGWKLAASNMSVVRLSLKITSDTLGWGNEVSISNPKQGDTITVPRVYDRYLLSGNVCTGQKGTVNKTYTVLQNGDIFYLVFDKTNTDPATGIKLNDVEDDIELTLTVGIPNVKLHVRYVTEDPDDNLVIPDADHSYVRVANVDDSLDAVATYNKRLSGTSIPQQEYTTIVMPYDAEYPDFRIVPVIPTYYELVKIEIGTGQDDGQDPEPGGICDFSVRQEYWATIYITPCTGDIRLYYWDFGTNSYNVED